MSQILRCLLLDGALLRGHPLWSTLERSGAAHALYADLGAEARQVGPWLWADKTLSDIDLPDLPERHGISEIHCMAELDDLLRHFSRVRYVETHDAQRYFLRYADMRSMRAVRAAFDDAQWQFLVGPITSWTYTDRQGQSQLFVHEMPAPAPHQEKGLKLSAAQLGTLLDAGLPDRLCLAIEELQEDGLQPNVDPAQYASVEAVARLLLQEDIQPYGLQRAIARKAVLLGGHAIESPEFLQVVRTVRSTGKSDAIDAWTPAHLHADVRHQHTTQEDPQ